MGFRDMEVFNLAMLARQGWRLLNDQNSLLFRLLKARYFPNSGLMDAQLGHLPSYAWRSLLRGRDLLEKGTRWHVGNGTNISVFGNRWLPRPSSFKPIGNPLGFDTNLRVSDLIDWSAGGWDVDCVKEVFLPLDAEIVLQMRLRDPTTEDIILWHHTKNGEFSVKNAYHMWMEEVSANTTAGSSDHSRTTLLWRKVWGIRVQPRVKNFIWRACCGILPCLKNLKRRRVLEDDLCHCCCVPKDDFHALFRCHYARQVWNFVPRQKALGKASSSCLDFAEAVIAKCLWEEVQVWAYLMNAI